MREIGGAVQRIDVPAILAALIVQSLLFAQHIMRRKLLGDALADQHLGGAVGRRHQIGVALVLDLQSLMEIRQQQRSGLASDGRHGGEIAFGMRCSR